MKKKKIGIIYSTTSSFEYQYESNEETETLPNEKQQLKVTLDKKQRAGKEVTIISGFVGKNEDLSTLAKMLKNKCGVGGSIKENKILIQGNHIEKILKILAENNYKAKKIGG
jgi:translation initiation factor 1